MGLSADPAGEPSKRPLPVGYVLDSRFVICQLLGMGGMGEVYEAEDLRLNRARIALKTIRSDYAAQAHIRERFQREVVLARSIAHPNVCPVYEFFVGSAPRGEVWFFTMKRLSGETLAACLDKLGPLPMEQALAVARDIGAALDAAHRAGIVHRDLKPGNVFLEEYQGGRRAVVTDFGLARQWPLDEAGAAASAVVGTARYIAPEILEGYNATPAADIYSFGVLLEDLLFGTVRAAATDSEAETKAPPRDPFSRGALQVIRRCRAARPEGRFSSAAAVLQALEEAASARPVRQLLSSRRKLLAGAAAGVAAMAGAGWWSRDAIANWLHPVPRPRRVAVLAGKSASPQDSSFLSGVMETVSGRLASAEPEERDLFVLPPRYLQQDEAAVGLYGVNLLLRASLTREADRLRVALILARAGSGVVLRQAAVACRSAALYLLPNLVARSAAGLLDVTRMDGSAPAAGDTTNAEAFACYARARDLLHKSGLPNIDAAVAELQKAVNLDGHFAKAWAELGQAYVARYNLAPDAETLDLAERNVKKASQIAPELASVFTAGASVKVSRGDYEHAVQDLETARRLDPDDADVQIALAHAYSAWGKLDLADQTYQRLIDERPNNWIPLNDWGKMYYRRANYARAEQLFREATIAAPDAALAWRNLGAVYLETAQYDEAQRASDHSIRLLPSGEAYTNRGTALFWLGHYREAAQAYQAAVDLNPRRYDLWRNLGDAYQMIAGMSASAREAWQKAAALARKELEVNRNNRDTLTDLALCEAKLGNRAAALALLSRASAVGDLDAGQLFVAAQAYELAGEREVALKLLKDCMDRGYSRFDVERAPELRALRKDGRFKKFASAAPAG